MDESGTAKKKEKARLRQIVGTFPNGVSGASILIMGVGLALHLVQGPTGGEALEPASFRELLAGLAGLQPGAVMTAGIILLVATPFLRVAGSLISFLFFERDVKYALVSAGLLILLAAGLLLSGSGV